MSILQAELATFFSAMIPVLELRFAIPLGVANGLHPLTAMVLAAIGNLVPIPFLILFTRHVFDWLKRWKPLSRLIEKLEARASKKSDVVLKYAGWGLCILVAIPLPGTGAWTGALVAAVLDLRLKKAMPAIIAGVAIAAVLVTLITYGATAFL